jgi:hypothetical protein
MDEEYVLIRAVDALDACDRAISPDMALDVMRKQDFVY